MRIKAIFTTVAALAVAVTVAAGPAQAVQAHGTGVHSAVARVTTHRGAGPNIICIPTKGC